MYKSLWLLGGLSRRAAQIADAVRQSSSSVSGGAASLGNREMARREPRKGFLEAWDKLRQRSSIRTDGFLALSAEGAALALCVRSHIECDRQNKVRNIGNPISWRAYTS